MERLEVALKTGAAVVGAVVGYLFGGCTVSSGNDIYAYYFNSLRDSLNSIQ